MSTFILSVSDKIDGIDSFDRSDIHIIRLTQEIYRKIDKKNFSALKNVKVSVCVLIKASKI